MRPVEKGARTPDQYLGVEARGAYDAFIDVEARKAAGTTKTAHFHTTAAGTAKTLITKTKHQDIVDEIIRQTPLQGVIWPINRWVHEKRAHTSEYQDAKERLTATIGEYCSFCERPVLSKLDIEHRVPKDVYDDRKFAWENFLLACGNCNSVKGTKHKVLLLQASVLAKRDPLALARRDPPVVSNYPSPKTPPAAPSAHRPPCRAADARSEGQESAEPPGAAGATGASWRPPCGATAASPPRDRARSSTNPCCASRRRAHHPPGNTFSTSSGRELGGGGAGGALTFRRSPRGEHGYGRRTSPAR